MAYAPQMNESAYRGEQVSPASGRRAAYRTKPCRYHQAGYCKDGRACPFRHEEDTQDMELRKSSIGRVPNVPQPSARARPSISIPSNAYPPQPVYPSVYSSPTATRVGPPGPPTYMVPSQYPHPEFGMISPVHMSAGDPLSSMSEDLMTPLDELGRMSEPFIRRPSYPYGSPASPPSAYQVYIPVTSPTMDYATVRYGMPPSKPRRDSHSSKKLAASFKTKHCKFWKRDDGVCPNGPKCTFIHDDSILRSSDDDSTEVGSPASAMSSQLPHDLPAKPLSPMEEKQRSGFFPISWRVIGGGVPLGGRREPCRAYMSGQCDQGDDCPFSHDNDSDDSASQPSDLGLNEGEWHDSAPSSPPGSIRNYSSSSGGPSARSKARPSSITVPPARDFYPSAGHLNSAPATAVPGSSGSRRSSHQNPGGENTPSPRSGGHRRTRSMVSSPGSSRLTQGDLFPAESDL